MSGLFKPSTTVVQSQPAASQGLQYTPEQIEQVSQPFGLQAPTGGITWDYPGKTGYADISQMYRDIADPLFQRAKAEQAKLGAFSPEEAATKFYQSYYEPELQRQQAQDYLALENRLLSQGMLGSTGGAMQVGELARAQESARRQAMGSAYQEAQGYLDAARQRQLQDIAAAAAIYESPQTLFQTGAGVGAGIGSILGAYRPAYAPQQAFQSPGIGTQLLSAGAQAAGAYYGAGGSDSRFKKNIKYIGSDLGLDFYSWEWNEKAKEKGVDKGETKGVIAQELLKTHPEFVIADKEGYLYVDYAGLAEVV
jgi:hypothetical protein